MHCFFVSLLLILIGTGSLFYTDALLEPGRLSRALLAGAFIVWLCRMLAQWFIYDRTVWRGHTLYTTMHVVLSLFWIYLVLTYGFALQSVWHG